MWQILRLLRNLLMNMTVPLGFWFQPKMPDFQVAFLKKNVAMFFAVYFVMKLWEPVKSAHCKFF